MVLFSGQRHSRGEISINGHTHKPNYSNPRCACMPRVNNLLHVYCIVTRQILLIDVHGEMAFYQIYTQILSHQIPRSLPVRAGRGRERGGGGRREREIEEEEGEGNWGGRGEKGEGDWGGRWQGGI